MAPTLRLLVAVVVTCAAVVEATTANAQNVRARDLGIPFDGVPGQYNAITDVPGVEVGHSTIIRGEGRLVKGEGPVRTGVTAILPRGRTYDPVMAATYALNGNGEMTGIHWIEESGYLETPITITNTFSVGVVRDAVIAWMDSTGLNADPEGGFWYTYPLVGETYDVLNDILGQHVTRRHTFEALDNAAPGPVAEGNVGGGTGMIAHEFKAGIGTSSRLTRHGHTLGVLVQANYGGRDRFRVSGVPVGLEVSDLMPNWDVLSRGSIIVVVATDAPLLPHQLQRLVERVPLAIGRMGGLGETSSGDIFVAFSTGNPGAWKRRPQANLDVMANTDMDALFTAVVDATEEAILNSLVSAETMTGRDGLTAYALPHDRLQAALRKYGRYIDPNTLIRAAAAPDLNRLRALVGTYRGNGFMADTRLYLDGDKLFIEAQSFLRRVIETDDGRLLLLDTGGVEIRTTDQVDVGRLQLMREGEVINDLVRVNP